MPSDQCTSFLSLIPEPTPIECGEGLRRIKVNMISSTDNTSMGFQLVSFLGKGGVTDNVFDVCTIDIKLPVNGESSLDSEFTFEYCVMTDNSYAVAVGLAGEDCVWDGEYSIVIDDSNTIANSEGLPLQEVSIIEFTLNGDVGVNVIAEVNYAEDCVTAKPSTSQLPSLAPSFAPTLKPSLSQSPSLSYAPSTKPSLSWAPSGSPSDQCSFFLNLIPSTTPDECGQGLRRIRISMTSSSDNRSMGLYTYAVLRQESDSLIFCGFGSLVLNQHPGGTDYDVEYCAPTQDAYDSIYYYAVMLVLHGETDCLWDGEYSVTIDGSTVLADSNSLALQSTTDILFFLKETTTNVVYSNNQAADVCCA